MPGDFGEISDWESWVGEYILPHLCRGMTDKVRESMTKVVGYTLNNISLSLSLLVRTGKEEEKKSVYVGGELAEFFKLGNF